MLCYLEGQTRDEAARQLGVTVAAVKGRLERGRDMLRDRLTRRGCCLGLGLTAAALAEDANAGPISERWADIATGHEAVPVAVERLASAAMLAGHGSAGRCSPASLDWPPRRRGCPSASGLIRRITACTAVVAGPPPFARIALAMPLPAALAVSAWNASLEPGSSTCQIAFSPDGKTVVAATHDGATPGRQPPESRSNNSRDLPTRGMWA